MYAKLIDVMGSDLKVANAARVSMHKESEWETRTLEDGAPGHVEIKKLAEKDARLIGYLARHGHWTPFGHCQATFLVKAPIFVARQMYKHQVGLVANEVSRRYVDDPPEFFNPVAWRKRADSVKQGSSATETVTTMLFKGEVEAWECPVDQAVSNLVTAAVATYQSMLDAGIAPEQARMVLPQNMYTEWYWTGSLAAFARICQLRLDPHAQQECRDLAVFFDLAMIDAFPVSWAALLGHTKAESVI